MTKLINPRVFTCKIISQVFIISFVINSKEKMIMIEAKFVTHHKNKEFWGMESLVSES
jgi:hypothetical protein